MKKRFPLFILVLVAFSGPGPSKTLRADTTAQNACSPVDLRGPRLGAVRNQGGSNVCWAYAGADLLSYRLGQRISAVDLVSSQRLRERQAFLSILNRKRYQGANLNSADSEISAIPFAARRGLCLEHDLPDSIPAEPDDLVLTLSQGRDNLLYLIQEKQFPDRITGQSCGPALDSLPLLSQAELLKIIAAVPAATGEAGVLNALVDAECSGRRLPPYSIQLHVDYSSDLKAIDQQLSRGNIVGISYNPSIAYGDLALDGRHLSTVVGRRLKDGKCQYLVRNTWGPECKIFIHQGTVSNIAECDKKDPGNYWVDASVLRHSLYDSEYISN